MIYCKRLYTIACKKSYFYQLSCTFLFSILFTCNTRNAEPEPDRLGYDFFPLQIGNYLIYDIEEITYSLAAEPVIASYQIKEVVADTFTDLSKEKVYQIKRYSRLNASVNWQLDSIWTARQNRVQAIRTENNVSFVKMVYPVTKNTIWNGNALNNLGEENYRFEALGQPFTVLQNDFESTVHVIQGSDTTANLINQDKKLEVYAKDVGLIYKEQVHLQFCSSSETCLGTGQIDFGTKFYQKLSSYGKE